MAHFIYSADTNVFILQSREFHRVLNRVSWECEWQWTFDLARMGVI